MHCQTLTLTLTLTGTLSDAEMFRPESHESSRSQALVNFNPNPNVRSSILTPTRMVFVQAASAAILEMQHMADRLTPPSTPVVRPLTLESRAT